MLGPLFFIAADLKAKPRQKAAPSSKVIKIGFFIVIGFDFIALPFCASKARLQLTNHAGRKRRQYGFVLAFAVSKIFKRI